MSAPSFAFQLRQYRGRDDGPRRLVNHPYRDVAIVGVHNTEQARVLWPDHTSATIAMEGALGALADAGIHPHQVDAVVSQFAQDFALQLRLGPCTRVINSMGIPS